MIIWFEHCPRALPSDCSNQIITESSESIWHRTRTHEWPCCCQDALVFVTPQRNDKQTKKTLTHHWIFNIQENGGGWQTKPHQQNQCSILKRLEIHSTSLTDILWYSFRIDRTKRPSAESLVTRRSKAVHSYSEASKLFGTDRYFTGDRLQKRA